MTDEYEGWLDYLENTGQLRWPTEQEEANMSTEAYITITDWEGNETMLFPASFPLSVRQDERCHLVASWLNREFRGLIPTTSLAVAQMGAFTQCETDVPPWQ